MGVIGLEGLCSLFIRCLFWVCQRLVRLLGKYIIIVMKRLFIRNSYNLGKVLEKQVLLKFISSVLYIVFSSDMWLFIVVKIIILMEGMILMKDGDMKFICSVNMVLLMVENMVVVQKMKILKLVMLQLEKCICFFLLCMVISRWFSLDLSMQWLNRMQLNSNFVLMKYSISLVWLVWIFQFIRVLRLVMLLMLLVSFCWLMMRMDRMVVMVCVMMEKYIFFIWCLNIVSLISMVSVVGIISMVRIVKVKLWKGFYMVGKVVIWFQFMKLGMFGVDWILVLMGLEVLSLRNMVM